MKEKIKTVIKLLQDELKFAKSLENEQCPEQDVTIENLEKAIAMLSEIAEPDVIKETKYIIACKDSGEYFCYDQYILPDGAYLSDDIFKATLYADQDELAGGLEAFKYFRGFYYKGTKVTKVTRSFEILEIMELN